MRKAKDLRGRLLGGVFAFALALGIFWIGFSMNVLVSHASQATVTSPNGAKIRQEASTTSNMVGGAEKGKVLEIISQVQGGDGYVWYQIKNGSVTGYVRSDLVEVSGEAVPSEGGEEGGDGGEVSSDLIAINPINGTVMGEAVEIRDAASAAGQVLGTVPNETVVTVTGYVTDAEGLVWYQLNYIAEDAQVDGFVVSDYVSLAGEVVPVGQEPSADDEPVSAPQAEQKRYDTVLNNGVWLLVDYETDPGNGYPVEDLINGVKNNAQMYYDSEAKVKSQKIIIIVLIFLLVAAVAGIAFLVFKVRDVMDSAYFNEVENETLKRKNAGIKEKGGQKVMHTVGGTEKPPVRTGTGTRPAGASQRPAGAGQGQRPVGSAQGQRPAGNAQGQRPAGTQGQRPAGAAQGQRPAGAQGQRPAGSAQGQRPVGASQGTRMAGTTQGQRPAGTQGQRPAGSAQGQRPAGTVQPRKTEGLQGQASQSARPAQSNPQKTQPKNFMADADDDEFEFEFLNYDGDDEQ